jgi:hypothetical protein
VPRIHVSVLIAATLVVLGFLVRDLVIPSRSTAAASVERNIAWVLCSSAIAAAQDRLVWELCTLEMVAVVRAIVVRAPPRLPTL